MKITKRLMISLLCVLVLLLFGSLGVAAAAESDSDLHIIDRPIKISEHRLELAAEYAKLHYGMNISTIVPQVLVIHWTESGDSESVYSYFYSEEAASDFYQNKGRLNVASQFLVDRDGTIYRLTPETLLDRHIIGLNWCAIGIENVGGVKGKEDLTDEQLVANEKLVRYLKGKYPTITYLIGHYQQNYMKETRLWRENVPGYQTVKVDPGPTFMQELIQRTRDLGLTTFPI